MEGNKKARIRAIIICGLIVLTITFIWSNSFQSVPESQADSLSVVEAIEPLLKLGSGRTKMDVERFRKVAHFAEFWLLGLELALLLIALRKVSLQNAVNCLFASLVVAVVDETIQVFSDRGSRVTDVLLDYSGAMTGLLVAFLVYWFVKKARLTRIRLNR